MTDPPKQKKESKETQRCVADAGQEGAISFIIFVTGARMGQQGLLCWWRCAARVVDYVSHQHMSTQGTVCVNLDDVIGVCSSFLVLHVGMN